ncbi:MAG: DUF4407 domain-containing protein [Cyclobacteriaceae bacterium]|nr:DUF4407 domain-containing protein [Cyclobacteriaceae bacterium]MCH8514785.1 DUF4407 domain-containing protein [Cyclobacteriaceae bacterium]
MQNILLKYACSIFSYDYEWMKTQSMSSRMKVRNLALLLLIPVFIIGLAIFLLLHYLLEAPFLLSIIAAVVLAFFVAVVDQSFVGMRAGFWSYCFRICFSLVIAFMGAVSLDLIVFGGDIEEYRENQQGALVQDVRRQYIQKNADRLTGLEEAIADQELRIAHAEADYLQEINGSGGTGKRGVGAIAARKEVLLQSKQAELQELERRLRVANQRLEAEAEEVAVAATYRSQSSLLSKLRDLKAVAFSDWLSMFYFGLFFMMFFLLENFFMIYKWLCPTTAGEAYIAWQDEQQHARLQQLAAQEAHKAKTRQLLGNSYYEELQAAGKGKVRRLL